MPKKPDKPHDQTSYPLWEALDLAPEDPGTGVKMVMSACPPRCVFVEFVVRSFPTGHVEVRQYLRDTKATLDLVEASLRLYRVISPADIPKDARFRIIEPARDGQKPLSLGTRKKLTEIRRNRAKTKV